MPLWFEILKKKFGRGEAHAFTLHLNTADYAIAGLRTASFLERTLAASDALDIVISYDRSAGVEFALPTMRQLADRALAGEPQQPVNPAIAALQATGAMPTQTGQGPPPWPRSPADALARLDDLLHASHPETGTPLRTALIIKYADTILPAADKDRMTPEDRTNLVRFLNWAIDPQLDQAGCLVIPLANDLSSLHSDIRAASSKYEAIEIPLPGIKARLDFIETYTEQQDIQFTNGLSPQTLANLTAGLSLIHIEDIFLNAGDGITTDLVAERKRSIFQSEYGDVLDTEDTIFTFNDIGGLELPKDFFRRRVIRPLKEGDENKCPMGVLLTGPAGTGKSILAKALAHEAGVNFVNLRIGGQIASKFQGEGERRLERALSAIESLAPTIVFIDEIDQAVQRGGASSSQQDKRIFQRLLDFMSDTSHRGKVVFLAATNRPDLMDAAMRRPGRFDRKLPILLPDATERLAILNLMAKKYMNVALEGDLDAVLLATEGWTGAELEALTMKADELIYDGEFDHPVRALDEATKRFRPSTADIEFMTQLAIRECNDTDLLPPAYKNFLDDRPALEQSIEQLKPAESFRGSRKEL